MRALPHALCLLAPLIFACGASSTDEQGEPPANLTMTPSVGFSSDAVPVVITGSGFLVKATQPQGGGAPLLDTHQRAFLGATELTNVVWRDTTRLDATVPAGLSPGAYDLTVENALGARGTARAAYTVISTPAFSEALTLSQAAVNVGQAFTLTLTATNGGTSDITDLALGVPTATSADGGSPGPPSAQPAVPSSLAAGAKTTFTWSYTAAHQGQVTFAVVLTGVDGAGAPVTAALAAPASLLIQLPSALTATFIEPPATQTVNVAVSLTLEVANASGAAPAIVSAVLPSSSPTSGITCTATSPPASSATPVQIAGGAAQRFTWSCTASAFGSYTLSAAITASDAHTSDAIAVSVPSILVVYTQQLTLTVNTGGAGRGSVRSTPAGIADCGHPGGVCAAPFTNLTVITLTATADPGSTFSSWSSGCTPSSSPSCRVTLDAARTVTATFALVREPLTINATTNGTIACGGSPCAASFPFGTSVTLTATPSTGHGFGAWTGACAAVTSRTCTLTMDGPKTVGASFTTDSEPLTISAPTNGTITCGGSPCAASFPFGTSVTLTASPSTGRDFGAWTGACAGVTSPTCTLLMNGPKTVGASFTVSSETLTINAPTNGTITCGGAPCAASFPFGTSVTLTASPTTGHGFGAWTGACAGVASPTCTLLMNGPKTVGASFTTDSEPLTISAPTNGTITCGGAPCAASFPFGTSVTLIASPTTGHGFGAWTGACAGVASPTCTLLMNGPKTVGASFTTDSEALTISAPTNGTITCGGAPCAASFPFGTSVTLTASPTTGHGFGAWTGACAGVASPSCTLLMNGPKTVGASFTTDSEPLTISAPTDGTITCGGAPCAASFPFGTSVTLTATPSAGNSFLGWSGDCASATTPTCTLTMDGPRTAGASFGAIAPPPPAGPAPPGGP